MVSGPEAQHSNHFAVINRGSKNTHKTTAKSPPLPLRTVALERRRGEDERENGGEEKKRGEERTDEEKREEERRSEEKRRRGEERKDEEKGGEERRAHRSSISGDGIVSAANPRALTYDGVSPMCGITIEPFLRNS